jgi:hypothetical protein
MKKIKEKPTLYAKIKLGRYVEEMKDLSEVRG